VIVVGGISDPDMAEGILEEGKADVIAFGRELIAQPDFANKVINGEANDIVKCIRCFGCNSQPKNYDEKANGPFGPVCTLNPRYGKYRHAYDNVPKTAEPQKVLVAGGGIAGMCAAVTAAERGHKVMLAEKSGSLGGTIHFADRVDSKSDIKKLREVYENRLAGTDVAVRLNACAEDVIQEFEPDVVIAAVGSAPVTPPIPGIDGENVMQALEAYAYPEKVGKRVVMIGGGQAGCELALHFAEEGHDVVGVEMMDQIMPDAFILHSVALNILMQGKMQYLTGHTAKNISSQGVTVADKEGNETLLEADTVIYALGQRARKDSVEKLRELAGDKPFHVIGDCDKPARIMEAIRMGYATALNI